MVNNSTNINKTNNHLSLSHLAQKPHIMTLACDRYNNIAGLKRLMDPNQPIMITGSPPKIQI